MRKLLIVVAGCGSILAGPSYAAGEGCSDFLWPLETELSWMKAPDSEKVASGVTIPAVPKDKAIELTLLPVAQASLPTKPTSTPKPEDASTLAGFVVISAIEPGHYQVSISSHAWMDVVQNGKPLDATGHTGAKNCDGLRKSVRFEIGEGPVTLQINNAPKDSIRIAVRPAAD